MKQQTKTIIKHLIILAVIFALFLFLIIVLLCLYYKFSMTHFRALFFDSSYNDVFINLFRKLIFGNNISLKLKIWVLCQDVFDIQDIQLNITRDICILEEEKKTLHSINDATRINEITQIQQAKFNAIKSKNDAETQALRMLARGFASGYDAEVDIIVATKERADR